MKGQTEREREREQKLFESPVGISRLTPLHPNQQQLRAWIFLAWNQIRSSTPVPGRLWKKKQPLLPPPPLLTPSSPPKKKEIQQQQCVAEKKTKSKAGAMEIAKELIFLQLKMDPLLQTQGKDISTRPWHASLAFSPLGAVACKRLLFDKYKLSFLCHPNPHFTLEVMWAHWTHGSHTQTNK